MYALEQVATDFWVAAVLIGTDRIRVVPNLAFGRALAYQSAKECKLRLHPGARGNTHHKRNCNGRSEPLHTIMGHLHSSGPIPSIIYMVQRPIGQPQIETD